MSNDKVPSKSKLQQDSIPPILKLPTEVLDYCWGYLRRTDLLRVSRVCRVFWHASTSWIFQSLTINLHPPSQRMLHSMNQSPRRLESATTQFSSFYSDSGARELWNTVQSWTVRAPQVIRSGTLFPVRLQEHEQRFAPQLGSVDTFFQFLSRSRNLRSLEFIRLDLRNEQWATLESLPVLETLRLISCVLSPSSHLERPLKLKELEIAGDGFSSCLIDEHAVSMFCNPAHLEKLTLIDSLATHTVLAALSSTMEYFPHLTYLSIKVKPFSRGNFFRFLAAIPSLTTLRIFPWSANITPDKPLPALSSLRSYSGYPHLLPHIVPGRPVDRVCLVLVVTDDCQPDDHAIHTDLMLENVLDISRSAVPVRRLTIEYFLPTSENLTAIARCLPDLHYLDLILISGPPSLIPEDLHCASNLLDISSTMGVVLSWIALGSAPLPPELQTLRLSYSPGWHQAMQSLEGTQQREIILCLHGRYPSLREVEMGDCRWWREGVRWSQEILDPEE